MSIKPGQTLGQYQIVEQIGKGGMATVYRSWQPSLARHVAIKVLPEFFTDDPSFHHRFRQEAMAIAQLRHPNVLTVFDSGEADGIAYIVTELVEGGTLARRLGTAMPVDECLRLIAPVAEALDYAHARGMIHRDVKPGNILLGSDGVPILSDFGLVRMQGGGTAADARTRLTMAGGTLGTPEYMAPEQIESSDVGPAADVYALAVILYEMLTGTVPYSAETPVSVLMSRLKDPLPRPRDRNPNIFDAVQDVLLKGLAKDPKDRYGSAGEMLRALAAANAPAVGATAAPSMTSSTHQRYVVVATAVLLLIGGIAAFVLRGAQPPPPAPAVVAAPAAAVATATAPAPRVARPAEPLPAAPKPVEVRTPPPIASAPLKTSDGLPPHGKLLYSMTAPAAELPALGPRQADAIAKTDAGVDVTLRNELGVQPRLPVEGVSDFVAVLKYVVTSRRPMMAFRFRLGRDGQGYVVRWPAFLHFSPAVAGTPAAGSHACCLTFDMFRAPQRPDAVALLEGPQPMTLPSRDGEEQVIAISASGPNISMFAGDLEIARVKDASFAQGGMTFGVNAGRGELPASLRMTALDIYEPAASGKAPPPPGLPSHGKLLFALADHLPAFAQLPQRGADNTITVNGTSLELKVGSDEPLTAPLGINGIGSFVAILKYAMVGLRPALRLRFGDRAVHIPAYFGLAPAADGTPASGSHACCQEFDIVRMPQTPGALTLFTGPPPRAVGAAPNQEQTATISVKGPQLVVYADGREIARVTDDTLRPGPIALQVQAMRRQVPAIVRLNALEIYEP